MHLIFIFFEEIVKHCAEMEAEMSEISLWTKFNAVLPIVAIVDTRIFCVNIDHGPSVQTIDRIERIERNLEPGRGLRVFFGQKQIQRQKNGLEVNVELVIFSMNIVRSFHDLNIELTKELKGIS